MLIVIEGLDGAGKSTQITKIREYMAAKGEKTEYLHFPRYGAPVYGPLISGFLRGDFGKIEEVHPQLVALLFAEDRHNAKSLLESWLADGKTIILDRYVYSNIAFQCAKAKGPEEAESLKKWIIGTEYGEYALPVPDINLFLDVPIDFVSARLNEERQGCDRDYLQGKGDIHEADIEFQKRVRDIYIGLTEEDRSFKRIDCRNSSGDMASETEIFERIRKELDK